MMNSKPYFFDCDLIELEELMDNWEEPRYRAEQIWRGMYQGLYTQPELITNISKDLRVKLTDYFNFSHLSPENTVHSRDGQTQKTSFRLQDGLEIEAVMMQYEKRRTLCISTQSGCAMGCVFCATGQMGFKRNLSSGEIVEQVIYFARLLGEKNENLTNIVVMGMGEPFHNYSETLAAIDRLNHPLGMNLGARRFTVSTVGLVPDILRFAGEHRQINLAVSLHAADDELRNSIIPINKKYPLAELMHACKEYIDTTRRRITFEWALIYDTNDTIEQASLLAGLLQDMLCHVNIIPLNPTYGYSGKASTMERAKRFQEELVHWGISCNIRVRRGIDIHAGCGQLVAMDSIKAYSIKETSNDRQSDTKSLC
jgi:23S rRNA (adenine2503-C2)-methyltransferase